MKAKMPCYIDSKQTCIGGGGSGPEGCRGGGLFCSTGGAGGLGCCIFGSGGGPSPSSAISDMYCKECRRKTAISIEAWFTLEIQRQQELICQRTGNISCEIKPTSLSIFALSTWTTGIGGRLQ